MDSLFRVQLRLWNNILWELPPVSLPNSKTGGGVGVRILESKQRGA